MRYLEAVITLAASADKDNKTKIMDSYFSELFPHAKDQKWVDSQKIQEILEREMQRGPMLVQKQNI